MRAPRSAPPPVLIATSVISVLEGFGPFFELNIEKPGVVAQPPAIEVIMTSLPNDDVTLMTSLP